MVYLHAKYEKPILNNKKVTARTRFVTDAGTDLTLRSKFKLKGHQQWYATHRLEVVYIHAKYEKPVLNDKKVTAWTRFVKDGAGRTDGQTDHYRASATKWRGPNNMINNQIRFRNKQTVLYLLNKSKKLSIN